MAPGRISSPNGHQPEIAWEQAHIDSWTADRIPRLDLQISEVRVTPYRCHGHRGPDANASSIGSIDEELDQARHHTVTT